VAQYGIELQRIIFLVKSPINVLSTNNVAIQAAGAAAKDTVVGTPSRLG